jgi:hypothetical protein
MQRVVVSQIRGLDSIAEEGYAFFSCHQMVLILRLVYVIEEPRILMLKFLEALRSRNEKIVAVGYKTFLKKFGTDFFLNSLLL